MAKGCVYGKNCEKYGVGTPSPLHSTPYPTSDSGSDSDSERVGWGVSGRAKGFAHSFIQLNLGEKNE